jgi:hypothetical protein
LHEAEVHLVAGPVISSGQSGFFDRFQQIEWASILLVTQAGFSLGNPIMCSAANMAFRKSSFLQVNGFEGNDHIPTGDDEFLLKKTVRHFGAVSARYMNDRNVLVKTRPHAKWSELFSQRITMGLQMAHARFDGTYVGSRISGNRSVGLGRIFGFVVPRMEGHLGFFLYLVFEDLV